MSLKIGTAERPLKVCIIGAGPAGFYTAGALIAKPDIHVEVDIFDQLPAPYGLVRYGIAPDHLRTKNVEKRYAKTAEEEQVRYFGNVGYGTDLSLDDLKAHYDMMVFTTGAQSDRNMGIPGEDLSGSMSATEFVYWYNGHPDFVQLDVNLEAENVGVIGVGNVALDVARILAKSASELHESDIVPHALAQLSRSKVKNIYIIGRRGPVQAKWTFPELKEMGELEIASVNLDANELQLDPKSAEALESDRTAKRNFGILESYAQRAPEEKKRQVHFKFLTSPVELIGSEGKVTALKLEKNKLEATESGYLNAVGTGEFETIPVELVLRSIGYRGVPLPDLPFHEKWAVIPNEAGRVVDSTTQVPLAGLYVAGWIKRGPTGVVGTNKTDASETVEKMFEDLENLAPVTSATPDIATLLEARNIAYITFDQWKLLDEAEIQRGEAFGRPRIKFVHTEEMLDFFK